MGADIAPLIVLGVASTMLLFLCVYTSDKLDRAERLSYEREDAIRGLLTLINPDDWMQARWMIAHSEVELSERDKQHMQEGSEGGS